MQFDSGPEGAGTGSQRVPLGASPCTPLNDDDQTTSEEILSQLPLQRLKSFTHSFTAVDLKEIQPVIRREANCTDLIREVPSEGSLSRARQAADNNQPRCACKGSHTFTVNRPGAQFVNHAL